MHAFSYVHAFNALSGTGIVCGAGHRERRAQGRGRCMGITRPRVAAARG